MSLVHVLSAVSLIACIVVASGSQSNCYSGPQMEELCANNCDDECTLIAKQSSFKGRWECFDLRNVSNNVTSEHNTLQDCTKLCNSRLGRFCFPFIDFAKPNDKGNLSSGVLLVSPRTVTGSCSDNQQARLRLGVLSKPAVRSLAFNVARRLVAIVLLAACSDCIDKMKEPRRIICRVSG